MDGGRGRVLATICLSRSLGASLLRLWEGGWVWVAGGVFGRLLVEDLWDSRAGVVVLVLKMCPAESRGDWLHGCWVSAVEAVGCLC